MPCRLIGFILTLSIVTVFIGFNLGNACDVSFGFARISQVPVYLTVFASFAAGMIAVLPYAFMRASRKKKEGRASRSRGSGRTGNPAGRAARRGAASADTELDDGAYGVD